MPQKPPDIDPPCYCRREICRCGPSASRRRPIKTYGDGERQYLGWRAEQDLAANLSKSSLNGFGASLLDRGHAPATARARQLAVRRFCGWLVEEGEMAVDPLLGIKAPQLDSKVIEPLTEYQLRALLKGPDTE